MNPLLGRRIIIGITGSIAAYKCAELIRALKQAGAEVRVAMTPAAQRFVGVVTLQALTGHPVATDTSSEGDTGMGHIDLARWADGILIAPASADFLARLCHGRANDLLTALCLATEAPVAVAPAMNRAMWQHPATRYNLALLEGRGVRVFGPDEGIQACGETGPGRMRAPEALRTDIAGLFTNQLLAGRRVLVTAGPTWEWIDPVRMLTNPSSGKMGFALARAAQEAGADVWLISGPTHLSPPEHVHLRTVVTAEEMRAVVMAHLPADVFIGASAVSDYRPEQPQREKIKKHEERITLVLVRNPDIVAEVAATDPRPFTVGFAAETGSLVDHARRKLLDKRLDLVIANRVGLPETGFGVEDNEVVLVDQETATELPRQPKDRLARQVIRDIARRAFGRISA
ncbi:MAG: bifunctional phosphopantothenoylcysteine decarboxylase/phosphopantothenate--cysteine ligase CoaBC [Acidiferrobacteraceae bacterium]